MTNQGVAELFCLAVETFILTMLPLDWLDSGWTFVSVFTGLETTGTAVSLLTSLGFELPYERMHEYEADRVGLLLSTTACWDPTASLGFFDLMVQLRARAALMALDAQGPQGAQAKNQGAMGTGQRQHQHGPTESGQPSAGSGSAAKEGKENATESWTQTETDYFSTHPQDEKRRSAIQAELHTMNPPKTACQMHREMFWQCMDPRAYGVGYKI
jgi:predicted Zn-dependent protease